jgi:D-beta-D-heptose 7-phosphate kinase/D-beta-D-heptose 1-phosphate adenosyltransferase
MRPIGSTARPVSFRQHLTGRWSPDRVPVLVVGDSMLDIYVEGAVERISPEAPVPVMRRQRMHETPGGAANVAANIVGLGGAAHLISVTGADGEGDRLAAALTEAGVSFDLVRTGARPTTTKTRFVSGQNQLLRLDSEEVSPIPTACEAEIAAAVAAHIDGCRLIVLSDYRKGVLTDIVLARLFALAAAHGVPVVVDPKRGDFTAYKGAAFLKPNLAELAAATGLPTSSDAEVEHAAGVLAATTAAGILVTRSGAGMSLVQPGQPAVHMPTHAREVYDVTGAGDTVIAAFALALATGQPPESAMAIANLAGGIAVSRAGTAIVLAEEVEVERSLLADDDVAAKGAIVDAEAATRLRQIWKRQGLVVGFTNGCFDLVHPGHVALLREAGKACDRLIVGLNSDASVRRLKGESRPVQAELARAAVLGAIDYVNLVVLFEDDTPYDLIKALAPDILVKGADYKVEEIVGADIVIAAGGKVMRVELVPGQSTTQLVGATRTTAR